MQGVNCTSYNGHFSTNRSHDLVTFKTFFLLLPSEKSQLHRTIEKLTSDLQEAKDKCEELREAKQETVRELLSLQDQHQEEIRLMRSDLQDEANSREGMDRRINDLRTELERLQAENAAEWGKRERLETEKLALERDNKKLRAELRDMQERIERKGRPVANSDTEFRHLQQELSDKNKVSKYFFCILF